jgi:hypothetical protein
VRGSRKICERFEEGMCGAGREKSLRESRNFRFLSTFYSFKEDLNMPNKDPVRLAEEAFQQANSLPSGPEKDALLELSRNYNAQAFEHESLFDELSHGTEKTLD